MPSRSLAALVLAGALIPAIGTSGRPASAQIGGGSLSITAPAAADLSAGTPINAGSLSAPLGPVTVTDSRTGVVAGWTTTVVATDFVTGGSSLAETIPRSGVAYWSGPATASTGVATFLPGQPDSSTAQTLEAPRVAFSAVTTAGGTSATWNPTLIVSIPIGVVVGQYHATITHSVA